MIATLKMRYGTRPVRETTAWYIAGSDSTLWLDEVASWDVAHKAVRLFVIPRSASDRRPAGTLVVVLDGSRPTKPSHRCVPYGKIAEHVYLPVEGWLDPDVSDAELGSLLSNSYTYVWHPVSGLVAFEPADSLRLCDLLAVGPKSARAWDRAVPGVATARQLISLAPERALTIQMIAGAGQEDIGTENDTLSDLPPSPSEPKSDMLSRSSRQGKRLLANIIHYFAQKVPATSDKPTWIDRLDNWSREQLANLQAGLNASRNKEIVRLLHLLETDPARGLRCAIPLGGDAHRGLGAPGDRLTERDTDFNLGNLGGGQAADFWDLPWAYQCQLTERYRELANREIRLGCHRRAAYIFAELLADFAAAAGTLVDGRHWREAAVLYEQRLHRPLEAARCLEQGGLWTEAIALYVKLKEHEKAGDLLGKLDQVDRAHAQYQQAVSQHRAGGDLLSAARLLEEKLGSVDEALDELSSGWPDTAQAVQCLHEVFQLLGRHRRHESVQQLITDFREGPLPARNSVELVNVLADAATDYPDRSVRDEAADCTRVLVSRQLMVASPTSSRQLLSAVSRLVPEDRLLSRDCLRYEHRRPAVATTRQKVTRPQRRPLLVRTIRLPGNEVSWRAATCGGNTIFVAGMLNEHLVLTRCSWHRADSPGRTWQTEPRLSGSPIILAADPQKEDFALVHVVGGPNLTTEHVFRATDACPIATIAGSIRGMSPFVLAAARTAHGVTWLLEWRNEGLTLVAAGPHGEQVSTQTLPVLGTEFGDPFSVVPIPLHTRGDTIYVGVENSLLVLDKAHSLETIEFAQRITSLAGSAPKTRTRVAVTFELGGTICWDNFESGHTAAFAGDMSYPVICFSKGGHLIAASQGCCEVYSTHDQRLQLAAEFAFDESGSQPMAVLPGPNANQFGIVLEVGEIKVYELP